MVAVASELLVLVVFIIVWSGGVCSSTAALVSACMVGPTLEVLGVKNCASGWIWGQGGKSGIEVGDWRLEIGRSARGW